MWHQGNIDRTLDRTKVFEAVVKIYKQTMTALVKGCLAKSTSPRR